jgi:hypothetical protein
MCLLFCFGSLERGDSVSGELDFYVFRYSELNPVVLESNYRTVNPARGDDLIARFQVVDHALQVLLPPPCRQKYDQVKDAQNKDERQEALKNTGWCLGLLLKEH